MNPLYQNAIQSLTGGLTSMPAPNTAGELQTMGLPTGGAQNQWQIQPALMQQLAGLNQRPMHQGRLLQNQISQWQNPGGNSVPGQGPPPAVQQWLASLGPGQPRTQGPWGQNHPGPYSMPNTQFPTNPAPGASGGSPIMPPMNSPKPMPPQGMGNSGQGK